jgi:hypothetical protein
MIKLHTESIPAPVAVYRNLPFSDYCKIQAMNQSLAKTYSEEYEGCPALFRHLSEAEDTSDSEALRFGRAMHTALLEPDLYREQYYILTPNDLEAIFAQWKSAGVTFKSKAAYMRFDSYQAAMDAGARGFTTSTAYREFCAAIGKEIINKQDAATIAGMVRGIADNESVWKTVHNAKLDDCEVSVTSAMQFKDGTSIPIKARLDIVIQGDSVVDLKTTRSTNARRFALDVARYGYDVQAAWYLRCALDAGLDCKRFGFLAQEKTPPYISVIHWLPAGWVKYAKIRMREILGSIKHSLETDSWPYPESGELEPPNYLKQIIEELS